MDISEPISTRTKIYYRYECYRYSVCVNPERELYGISRVRLQLQEYPLRSKTSKGVWIGILGGKDRWVSNISKKRFAHPTKEEALEAYRLRKQSYVNHCVKRLTNAKEELSLVNKTTI